MKGGPKEERLKAERGPKEKRLKGGPKKGFKRRSKGGGAETEGLKGGMGKTERLVTSESQDLILV